MNNKHRTKKQLIEKLEAWRKRALQAEALLTASPLDNSNRQTQAAVLAQVDELAVLHTVAMDSVQATSEDELISRITLRISEAFHCDNCGFLLLDTRTQTLHPHDSYQGLSRPVPATAGRMARAVQHGTLQHDTELAGNEPAVTMAEDTFAALCIAIEVGGAVAGIVNLEKKESQTFSKTDKRLLILLAQQMSLALDRVRLFAEERHRTNQQRQLAKAAGAILAALNMTELWSAVSTATQEILGADKTAVFLHDPETDKLSRAYADNLSQNFLETIEVEFPQTPKLWHRGEIVYSSDAQSDPSIGSSRSLFADEDIHTFAILPFASNDDELSGVAVYRTSPQPFTEDDLTTGQTLSHIIAVGLQNVRLFSAKTHALVREQQLNEFSRTLNDVHDLPTILSRVVYMATQLLDADGGKLGLIVDDQVMIFYPYNLPNEVNLTPVTKGQGLAWEIAETCEPVRLQNPNPHKWNEQEGPTSNTKAYLGVPIIATGDICLGTLGLFRFNTDKPFSEREQALAESLARQAGAAIQNARLYAEFEQRTNALAAALTRQEELDRLKNFFVQNVSHELRTPLGIIYGHAELLESGTLGDVQPEQLESIQIIARRARMLTDMVEDLTALLAAETQEFRRQEINPADLANSTLADYQLKAEEMGLEMEAVIDRDVPWLIGDPTHLRRVFDNLVSNAFKFTPEGGKIIIRLWAEAEGVIMEVSDSGIGIPKDQLDRVFERFYQIDGSPTRRFSGTGLGLALVKEIVEAHRGEVSVQSNEGKGTTFRIVLPAYALDEEEDKE